jgi:DNA (cytosine-5)-methyltransferase 1
MAIFSLDLFSGVGGLSEGMHQAGFKTQLAFEIDDIASKAYKLNHTRTKVITKDIQKVKIAEEKKFIF